MKTAKTPYEIRLDLLQLAFDILMERARSDAAQYAIDHATEVLLVVKAPTSEEVVAEAEKLNNFVSKAAHQ